MVIKEKEDSSDQIEWNVETEVQLFYAMTGHKPVGVNKHFQMACILEKFRNALNRDISSKVIWDHLDTMYDMQALDDTENLPFPNDDKDFSLPESEFGALIEQRMKIDSNQEAAENENESKTEIKPIKEGNKKDSIKKEARDSIVKKEVKEVKDSVKEIKGEVKDLPKEPKKVHKDRESRRESKDSKEGKKDSRKESREEVKSESSESREPKVVKQKSSIKEKREVKKEDSEKDDTAVTPNVRKERARESSDDSIKRSGNSSSKRSTRGSIKPDEMNSSKSSSPITTPTPPPVKRRRT